MKRQEGHFLNDLMPGTSEKPIYLNVSRTQFVIMSFGRFYNFVTIVSQVSLPATTASVPFSRHCPDRRLTRHAKRSEVSKQILVTLCTSCREMRISHLDVRMTPMEGAEQTFRFSQVRLCCLTRRSPIILTDRSTIANKKFRGGNPDGRGSAGGGVGGSGRVGGGGVW